MKDERDELEGKSSEYETGFTIGMIIGAVVVACILALMITITLKLMKWIWLS